MDKSQFQSVFFEIVFEILSSNFLVCDLNHHVSWKVHRLTKKWMNKSSFVFMYLSYVANHFWNFLTIKNIDE